MARKNLLGAMDAVIALDKPQVWRGELKKANVTEYHRNWMRAKRARNGGMQASFSLDADAERNHRHQRDDTDDNATCRENVAHWSPPQIADS